MLERTLGKSKLEVSALGMGCWAIGGPWIWDQPRRDPYPAGWGDTDDEESIRAIHAALDAGINLIDTAPAYGESEQRLGFFIEAHRNHIVLCTKCGEQYQDGRSAYDFSAADEFHDEQRCALGLLVEGTNEVMTERVLP